MIERNPQLSTSASWLRPLWSAVSSKPRRTALAGGYVALGLFLAQNVVSMWSKGDEQSRSAQKTQEMTDRELAEISRRLLPGKDKADGSLAKVDQWLIDELSVAMESDPVQGAVRQRLDAAIERMLANPAFQERVLQLARPLAGNAAVNPPASASTDAASNTVESTADQTSVPSDLNKGEGAPSSPSLPPASSPIPGNPVPASPSSATPSPEIPKVDGTPSATSPENSTPPAEEDQNSSSTTTEAPNNRN